jgi:uncharacterized membrane protein YadS
MPVGILEVVVRIGLLLATTFLFGIVLVTYLRLKNHKMLLITAGFGVFFASSLIAVPELFSESYAIALDENIHLLIHLIGLILILLGILKG